MEKNINVVIVDSDINYRKFYEERVKMLGGEVLLATAEPFKAMDCIKSKCPNFLVLDIVLHGYDAFEFIRSVREESPSTNIIVVTYFVNEYIEKLCEDLGVVRYINKINSSEVLSFVFLQNSGFENIGNAGVDIEIASDKMMCDLIDEILESLHLPIHIKGSLYIKVAVKDMIRRKVKFESMSVTKEIYPTVAEICNTTAAKVERSIRYCIEYIFNNGTMDIVPSDMFALNAKGNYKLSNSKFLIIIAEYTRRKLDSYMNGESFERNFLFPLDLRCNL